MSDRASHIPNMPESLCAGRYLFEGRLGEGGMAAVFLATDTTLQVKRAVKVLTIAHGKSSLRRRLNAEARAMARLKHPNILGVHDVGTDGELDFVVMDLAFGSLQDVIESTGPMALGDAVQYTIQVLSALACAHAEGIVHRDVKPHNVLLDMNGRALLADFGIALLVEDDRRTKTGVAMGSLAYMPPEQRLDAARVGPAADIYSAGAMLYNLLTNDNPVDLFLAEDDSDRFAGLPPDVVKVIRTATQVTITERYASAGEMAGELVSLLEAMDPSALDRVWRLKNHEQFPAPSERFTHGTQTSRQTPAPANATARREHVDAAFTFVEALPEEQRAKRTPTLIPSQSELSQPVLASPATPTIEPEPSRLKGFVAVFGLFFLLIALTSGLVVWQVMSTFNPGQTSSIPDGVTGGESTVLEPVDVNVEPVPIDDPVEPAVEAEPDVAVVATEPVPVPVAPTPEPEVVAVPEPAVVVESGGSSGSTGVWTGSLDGQAMSMNLRGPASALRGTFT
jgi:serine/threonine-protein kinase